MTDMIRILIVDDHTLVRKGLIALLGDRADMQIVGEAAGGEEAVNLAVKHLPDVILMDLDMPGGDGVAATQKIKAERISAKILVLTSFTDENRVISAIRAGVDGYLLKTTMPGELIRGIKDVYQGRTPLDPRISGTVLQEINSPVEPPHRADEELSARERMVLECIVHGKTNRQIAQELNISERTVSTHVTHILNKLNVENRTQAAFLALRSGLVKFDDPS